MKSTLCERLRLLLGIAEKRENSFIQAVNEMSFAIHFHCCHVKDLQHPRVAPTHTGGCYFGGGLGKGGTCTKASKHHCPFPRAWGLCLPWVLWPGEVAKPPLSAQDPRRGSTETWQRNTPFLWDLAPEISLDFIFHSSHHMSISLIFLMDSQQSPAAFLTPARLSNAAQTLFSILLPLPAPSPLLQPFPIAE